MEYSTNIAAAEAAHASGVSIREATTEELGDALRVQRVGFSRVAALIGIDPMDMPPVRETLEELHDFRRQGMRTFIATVPGDDREIVVGTVRGMLTDTGTVEIGRLAVDPHFLRRGIARALMMHLEAAFPTARRFELFTGSDATAPLSLYGSLGYRIYATENHEYWTLVRLEKDAPGATDAR